MTAAAVAVAVPNGGVLVASANAQLRERLLSKLGPRSGPVHIASGGAEAFAKLDHGQWQMLILDRQLPDLNAEELVDLTNRLYPGVQVLVVDSSSDEMKGAAGWWSSREGQAGSVSSQPTQLRYLEHENRVSPKRDEPLPGMIGEAEPMRDVYRRVRLVARRNTTVLVTGPSGSGKELVARALHCLSARANSSFSVLNCAAIPETLIESELFGYARGAFTGAAQTYAGRILAAQGGTLFLDEIGELPLNAQSKLLRFLEQKEVQRLGSAETSKVDVRVVAATNRDLVELVKSKQFRDDLFFRLCAFPINLSPLAERREDIPKLVAHFIEQIGAQRRLRLDFAAEQMLEAYAWPGNVRELQQVLERAAILAEDQPLILPEHLIFSFPRNANGAGKVA